MSTDPASSLGFGEVGSVAMYAEYHLAWLVLYCRIGMRSSVVKEYCDGVSGGGSSLGLCGGESAECDCHCWIHGASIV